MYCGISTNAECIPCDRQSNAGLLPAMVGQAENFALRRAGAEVDAKWRFGVSRDGWYRLTHAQLIAAGMASNALIGSQIRMYNRTQEVAILVSSTNVLGPQDTIHFYGIQHDGAYSRTNVYWLGLGGEGRRINLISGSPIGGETTVTSVCFSAVHNPKLLHRPYHRPDDVDIDHWFAGLADHLSDMTVLLNTSNRVAGEMADLQIVMYGLTTTNGIDPDHRTRIRVNGTEIASPTYDGPNLFSTNYAVSNNLLTLGMSSVVLRQTGNSFPGVPQDRAYLISLRLDYLATNTMRNVSHEFCGKPGTNRYRVAHVTTNGGFWVLDIADPFAPVVITNAAVSNTNVLMFSHTSSNVSRLAVVQSNGVINAPTPLQFNFRNLADTARQADYLLITPYEFREHAYRLAKHRFTNGLNVTVAPLPDIYNEFGYGIIDADSIKQFIGYTYHHWNSPQPRFALLLGEGTYDPLGYIGSIPRVNIPVHYGQTPFVVAAQDVWYGLVDGTTNAGNDFLADVAIGRMSLSSNAPLTNIISKVIRYDGAVMPTNALLVTDQFDGVNNFFTSSDNNIRPYLQTNGIGFVAYQKPGSATPANIIATINNGRRLVTFVGHGALDRWSSDILTIANLSSLTNVIFPLVTIFSCQNGSFVERETNSLSEAFIELPKGASSVFSPTALSSQVFADKMAAGFMNSYASDKRRYLGDVAFDAYLNLWSLNTTASELLTYQVLGDPALIVNRPGTLP